jgi:acyl-CoA thioester hydrolase
MTDYEYTYPIDIRYRDIDTQRIVNNGVFPTYLTEARTGYFEEVLGRAAEEIQDIVTARMEIDYLEPVERGDDLTVHLRCADVGASSFTIEYEIRADGTPAARATTVQVYIDPETGESRAIEPDVRRRFAPE